MSPEELDACREARRAAAAENAAQEAAAADNAAAAGKAAKEAVAAGKAAKKDAWHLSPPPPQPREGSHHATVREERRCPARSGATC